MNTKRVISIALFVCAALMTLVLASAYLFGDIKGFGSLIFAVFFLAMAGWVIGDY